jgi:thiamine transport system ATP-binding protein
MLEVTDLTVRFGASIAVNGASLAVEDRSVHALMGPSGSGKSTMLRAVAGLERPDSGDIRWNGHSMLAVPTHQRDFGLMFQEYALFPHRTVGGNVAFGLRMQGMDATSMRRNVNEILELVGLPGYQDRSVGTLSGGERQRVALARTLAPRPRLVLLDEPLGALDRSLRERLLIEMAAVFAAVEATVLYVTHDRDEAFTIADQVAVIRDGEIIADATPTGLWTDPPDKWTAGFIGLENLLSVDALARIGLVAPSPEFTTGVIPPEAIALGPDGRQSGGVLGSYFRGGVYRVELDLGSGVDLVAWSPAGLEAGTIARFNVDADRITWFVD